MRKLKHRNVVEYVGTGSWDSESRMETLFLVCVHVGHLSLRGVRGRIRGKGQVLPPSALAEHGYGELELNDARCGSHMVWHTLHDLP